MKRIILVNGLIAGIIVAAMLLASIPLHQNGIIDYDSGMLIGYTTMVIGLSTIFFGIKTYRDQLNGGTVSFGRAFGIGISIAAIAAVIYAVTWDVYYRFRGEEFTDYIAACQIEELQEDGASQEEIARAKTQFQQFGEMYRNTFVRFGFSMFEIFPVGIIITFVSSLLLRKRKFLPAV